jgi:hypothetical protein
MLGSHVIQWDSISVDGAVEQNNNPFGEFDSRHRAG